MAQICEEIRDNPLVFQTGDCGIDVVEWLDVILPDDAIVKDPVCDHQDYEDEEDGPIPEGFADSDCAMPGFTMILPAREHKVAYGYAQELRNALDKVSRYTVDEMSDPGDSSLSFKLEAWEGGDIYMKVRFYQDDSTR